LRPVLTKVTAECRVGRDFVAKIERELMENEHVLVPEEIYMAHAHPISPGSRSISREDFYMLYILYRQQPTRLLRSFVYWLFCCRDDCVGQCRVAVVSLRLPDLRPASGAKSCPVQQVLAQQHGEGVGVPQTHCKDKPLLNLGTSLEFNVKVIYHL
jgi:hypothetical protein